MSSLYVGALNLLDNLSITGNKNNSSNSNSNISSQHVPDAAVQRSARHLDRETRNELALDVARTLHDDRIHQELQEIEVALAQAKTALSSASEKEQFLGLRSRQYRKALDEQAKRLLEQQKHQSEMTVEESEDLEHRLEKWEKDEDALQSILDTHTTILAHCEDMRRRIDKLEKKRLQTCRLKEECVDFLQVATAENAITTETEMSSLNQNDRLSPNNVVQLEEGTRNDDDDEDEDDADEEVEEFIL